jgi:hypothetical protein
MTFKTGQKVRYVETYSRDLMGEEGVVASDQYRNNVNVRFKSESLNRGRDFVRGVKPENIELIPDVLFKYDPSQAGDQDDDI